MLTSANQAMGFTILTAVLATALIIFIVLMLEPINAEAGSTTALFSLKDRSGPITALSGSCNGKPVYTTTYPDNSTVSRLYNGKLIGYSTVKGINSDEADRNQQALNYLN